MNLLEIKNLHASIGDTKILHGIDLTINRGEVHAIMGPNGSGKSAPFPMYYRGVMGMR